MNILTFDIEDWFHTHQNRKDYSGHIWEKLPSRIEVNTDRILAMLEELDLKATFFVLGWVAEHHPKLVKRIHTKGHEIAAHSNWHHNPQLLSPENFEKDLVLCLAHLQDACGEKVIAYRAPGFNLNLKDKWAFEILANNGISIDSSVELRNAPSSLPLFIETGGEQILEFPLLKTRFGFPYSGGGYFRLIPPVLLNHFFKDQKYRLLYFHPRDFDPDNPYTNLFSLFRNTLNKINTGVCMDKLKDILKQMDTITMGQAVENYKGNTSTDD